LWHTDTVILSPGISEWYSPVAPGTGLHPRPSSARALREHFPEIDADVWPSLWMPPRTGEEVEEVHQRAIDFLQLFILTLEQRWPGLHKRVVLMGHAATVITLARALTADRNLPVRVGCCSVTELVRAPDAERMLGGWKVRRLNDGTFLKDGAGRDWGFEDIEIADGKVVQDIGEPGTEGEADDNYGPQIRLPVPLSNL